MNKRSLLQIGIGAFLGAILIAAFALPTSAGAITNVGALQTGTPATTRTATPRPPTPTPTATPRAGTLNVAPASAAVGTEITITGSGFSANALIVIIVEDNAGATASYTQPSVDGSGGFTMRLSTTAWKAGEYAVTAAALPNPNTLSRASLTLTGMPGLPNTGDGGTTPRAPWAVLFLGGATALLLLGVARRRHAI